MQIFRLALLTVLLGVGFAAAAASTDAARKKPSAAEARLDAVYAQYQRDIYQAMSASDQPRHWLMAAQMANFQDFITPRSGVSAAERTALYDRALDAASDDAFIYWHAALECPTAKQHCRAAEVVARLKMLEPDNAAVWALIAAQEPAKPSAPQAGAALDKTEREFLKLAARASRFETHLIEAIGVWSEAMALVPVPAELLADGSQQDSYPTTELGVRTIQALGITLAVAMPSYMAFSDLCNPKNAYVEDATIRADCLAFSGVLRRNQTDILPRIIGLNLAYKLLRGTPEASAVEQAIRQYDWVREAHMQTNFDVDLFKDDTKLQAYLNDLREVGEFGAICRQLSGAGISLEPPADYQSFTLARYREEAE